MSVLFEQQIQPKVRTIDGLSIRYAESELRERHALLLSPWPESIYCYEPTWSRLAQHTHLVAVDLPGFGRSERRNSLMSPKAMGEFIARLADHFDLDKPHVVGPDIGTAASLFAAALHPTRFGRLTVGTGGTAVPLQLGNPLKEWVEAPSVEPYRAKGSQIVSAAIGTLERYKLSSAAREDYISSFEGDRFAESMRYVRTYPEQLPQLRRLLPTIETPVLIISGSRDRVVPPVNAEFLHEHLPNSKLDIIEGGHFIWEDAAESYAELVTSWWAGAYKNNSRNMARPDVGLIAS